MAKKSKDHKVGKGNKGKKEYKASPSAQSRDQKFDQGRGFSSESDKMQTSQDTQLADAQIGQGTNLPEGQESQGIDLPEVLTTKKSCLPKLVVLLLPFIAIGAYWFLG